LLSGENSIETLAPPPPIPFQVGMRLLEVNGHSLLGASHQDAVNVLRNAGNEIQLVVCKGYDKSNLIHSIGQAGGMSTGFNSSASCSGGSRQGT